MFALSMMLLLQFAAEPMSTAKPNDAILQARADDALRIIGGSPGHPVTWGESEAQIQAMDRLGLVEPGKLRTLDVAKFDALAKGKATGSVVDDRVDYEEARQALGLHAYNFHLRAYPVFQPFPHGSYGVTGMDEWRVAYIGHWGGSDWSTEAKLEAGALDDLPIAFTNTTNAGTAGSGDKFKDSSTDLRNNLVPLLGAIQEVTAVSGTLPTEQFTRMNATVLTDRGFSAPRTPATGTNNFALAIGTTDVGPTYAKNTDMRGVLGYANLSLLSNPRISFYEIVHGEGYNQTTETCLLGVCTTTPLASFVDYGVVEASLDGGATWTTLTPADSLSLQPGRMPSVYSSETLTAPAGLVPTTWKKHTVDFSACPACLDEEEVLLAVRWISNNDNDIGAGWFIDDFVVEDAGTGLKVMDLSFESPYYNGVIIGSNVGQNAMTPAELKYAIKDFVMQGGKLFVMGGQQNVQWLQPLFSVGISGTSGQAFAPDNTHPLLSIPNQLAHSEFEDHDQAWTFSQHNAQDLFSNVVQGDSSNEYVLSVNNPNSFGDGQVILTTWLPSEMDPEEMRKWFANAIVYGKYHYLYMEVGPSVPPNTPVASASMTALMDKTRDGSREYIEMALILYVWE